MGGRSRGHGVAVSQYEKEWFGVFVNLPSNIDALCFIGFLMTRNAGRGKREAEKEISCFSFEILSDVMRVELSAPAKRIPLVDQQPFYWRNRRAHSEREFDFFPTFCGLR